MANSKAAKKRININRRNQLQNKYYKTSFRTLKKRFLKNLELLNSESWETKPKARRNLISILNSIFSILDKGTKKNIFHKNTVARNKRKLTHLLVQTSRRNGLFFDYF